MASQFIGNFFKHFPELSDTAIDAQFDLCEDDDTQVSLPKIFTQLKIVAMVALYNIYSINITVMSSFRYGGKLSKICRSSVRATQRPPYAWATH